MKPVRRIIIKRKLTTCILLSICMILNASSFLSITAIDTPLSYQLKYKIEDFVNELNSALTTSQRAVLPSAVTNSDIDILSIKKLYTIDSPQIYAYMVDVRDKYNNTAHFVLKADSHRVIEFSTGSSVIFDANNDCKFYYTPTQLWIQNSDNTITNVNRGITVSNSDALSSLTSHYASVLKTEDLSTATAKMDKYLNETRAITNGPVDYIDGVPNYYQAFGYLCINTSILNVIGYWDTHGYPNLITSSDALLGSVRAEIQNLMNTYGAEAANTNIPPTMCAFFAVKNYLGAEGYAVEFDKQPLIVPINMLSAEIYYNTPCLLGFPTYFDNPQTPIVDPHMTTAIGYGIIDNVEYAIVRDTYDYTAADRWVDIEESDWLIGFNPPNYLDFQ